MGLPATSTIESPPMAAQRPVLLRVRGLTKKFPIPRGIADAMLGRAARVIHAVNDVGLEIGREETFGLVGESGSGKSTTGKLIARLLKPSGGTIELDGTDWLGLRGETLRSRRRDVQMLFQNPFLSLNPRWSIGRIVAEPLAAHGVGTKAEIRDRVDTLLNEVGLDPSFARRFPHQFSGGQRQRIGLARALALKPRLLIADEPTSALDVSIQARNLNLLQSIKREHHLSMLFISHDMRVIRHICDTVGVMYLGTLVEVAPAATLFAAPLHPYTQSLLEAVPKLTTAQRDAFVPPRGEVPNPVNPPAGCYFHPRCPRARPVCRSEAPAMRTISPGRSVACHLA